MNARTHSTVAAALAACFVSASASADPNLVAQAPSAVPAAPPPQPPAPAVVPQPTPPPSAVPAPTPEELRRRRIVVHIDATRPSSVVERRVSVKENIGAFIILPYRGSESTWEQICVTPCSVDLDRFSTYRVPAQNHVSASRPFTLPQGRDVLHLKIDSGDLVAHRTGEAMGGIGVAAIIVGVGLLAASPNFHHPDDARIAGGTTGGIGILLAAVGIPLAYLTRTTVAAEESGKIANVYWYQGHKVPFLPEVDLRHGFTLTQRGIVF